jgi:hypothetical protein
VRTKDIVSDRRPDTVEEATSFLQAQGLNFFSLIRRITSAVRAAGGRLDRLETIVNNGTVSGYDLCIPSLELKWLFTTPKTSIPHC